MASHDATYTDTFYVSLQEVLAKVQAVGCGFKICETGTKEVDGRIVEKNNFHLLCVQLQFWTVSSENYSKTPLNPWNSPKQSTSRDGQLIAKLEHVAKWIGRWTQDQKV